MGSGDGSFMKTVNFDKKYKVTGVELFDPYIKKAKSTRAYAKLVKGSVVDVDLKNEFFDVVHASQVIEHLTKKEAKKFLQNAHNHCRRILIIGTPNGHFHQEEYDQNHLQEHKSAWKPKDFVKLDFRVYGQGLKIIYGEHGFMNTRLGSLGPIRTILIFVSYIFSPLVYYLPEYAAHIIAVQKK